MTHSRTPRPVPLPFTAPTTPDLPSSGVAARGQEAGAQAGARPTVVLVHGAFADASSWNDTITRLRRAGYPVVAPANPLRGLDYDAAYVRGRLQAVEGPKIVVGHSYGGAVITNAAADSHEVRALVYVAAFIPEAEETLGALMEQHPDSAIPPLPQQTFSYTLSDAATGTDVFLDPAQFRASFAADVSEEKAALMAASQRPVSVAAFDQPTRRAAWKELPSWALIATEDQAIGAPLERFMAERAGARISEVAGSHAVMVSNPDAVSRIIEQADLATR
ncbi:alpha/beta hydrolase [Streptomyces microflavus]|uniref:alpha/beta fold hydrolase n=1 Tax=Streptomyces microflavus TaxID=1919 RepID=UPI002DDA1C8C|nr:alpha/beta hydrolase [Streptomyces microflavus]WSA64423.1 alpha/beta hydrolase [Streptomyces microflavus]